MQKVKYILSIVLIAIGFIIGMETAPSKRAEIATLENSIKLHELRERQFKDSVKLLKNHEATLYKHIAKLSTRIRLDSSKVATAITVVRTIYIKPYTAPQIDSLWKQRYDEEESLHRDELIQADLERKDALITVTETQGTLIDDMAEQIKTQDSLVVNLHNQNGLLSNAIVQADSIAVDKDSQLKLEKKRHRKVAIQRDIAIGVSVLLLVVLL